MGFLAIAPNNIHLQYFKELISFCIPSQIRTETQLRTAFETVAQTIPPKGYKNKYNIYTYLNPPACFDQISFVIARPKFNFYVLPTILDTIYLCASRDSNPNGHNAQQIFLLLYVTIAKHFKILALLPLQSYAALREVA